MLGAFIKAGINKFEISIKFCVFLIPILTLKFFWVIIALFAILKCKCEKNYTFSNILQKVKSYFFANINHSPCASCWNSKKSMKFKPPSVPTVLTSLILLASLRFWHLLCPTVDGFPVLAGVPAVAGKVFGIFM